MHKVSSGLAATGALSAALAVLTGAFATHELRESIPQDRLEIFETAARYQMYHALAILAAGWLAERTSGRLALLSGIFFASGTVLFSGSLYGLALTGVRALGAITPVGGGLFLGGWVAFVWAAIRR